MVECHCNSGLDRQHLGGLVTKLFPVKFKDLSRDEATVITLLLMDNHVSAELSYLSGCDVFSEPAAARLAVESLHRQATPTGTPALTGGQVAPVALVMLSTSVWNWSTIWALNEISKEYHS
jgi:hypothetical protein